MIETLFNDILTDFNCAALVTDLTKFILYSKQQIPFTYDKLHYAVRKRNKQDRKQHGIISSSERLFRSAEASVNSFEDLFSKITEELSKTNSGTITEVAVILGGSIATAKQAYRIHVPILELGHSPKYHSERAIMDQVLNAILKSESLDHMLTKKVEPTNMFILLRKRTSCNVALERWLLPQPRYNIPPVCQQFHFKFDSLRASDVCCHCKGFAVFSDVSDANISLPATEESFREAEETSEFWYQAPIIFKGFKDVYVKGVSVSQNWLKLGTSE